MKILDIGCGDKKHPGSIGIDLNYKEADIMLDLDKNNIPFQDKTFDLVISDDSLEHFGNPKHIFEEVYRVLKPGGIFRVETVNVGVWWVRYLPIDWNWGWLHKIKTKRTGHLVHWTPSTLKMWFELNNFKIVKNKSNYFFKYRIMMEGMKV